MIVVALASAAHAGAWTKEVGQFYGKAGVDVYRAFQFVQPGSASGTPGALSAGSYFGQQYGLYAEAGVLPGYKGQLSVQAPLVVGTTSFDAEEAVVPLRATSARLGDLTLSGQVALHPDLPLAAALQVKVPMYANGEVGARYPTWNAVFPKPGDGQVDLTGWVYAGAPVGEGFVEGGLGYRHRTESFVGWATTASFVDGVVGTVKGGWPLGPVLPIVALDGLVNVADDLYSRQYVSASASALVDVAEGVAIEPRVASELWAKNSSRGLAAGLGVSWRH